MRTAKDVARAYSPEAVWVPCGSSIPPESEPVEVLYADGYVYRCRRAGRLYLMEPSGVYRYVEPAFWRPLPD